MLNIVSAVTSMIACGLMCNAMIDLWFVDDDVLLIERPSADRRCNLQGVLV